MGLGLYQLDSVVLDLWERPYILAHPLGYDFIVYYVAWEMAGGNFHMIIAFTLQSKDARSMSVLIYVRWLRLWPPGGSTDSGDPLGVRLWPRFLLVSSSHRPPTVTMSTWILYLQNVWVSLPPSSFFTWTNGQRFFCRRTGRIRSVHSCCDIAGSFYLEIWPLLLSLGLGS